MSKQDEYAGKVLRAGRDMGITARGIVIGFATVFVESSWRNYANSKVPESLALPHDAVGSDGFSCGLFQQQVVWGNGGWWWGSATEAMDPYKSARLFFDRLAKRDYNNGDPGAHAQAIQRSAYPDRYGQRMAEAQKLYDRIAKEPTVPDNRPDFNEWPRWSPNVSSRNGTKVDAFFLHTQEGGGGDSAAEDLAKWMEGNKVSYHYTISQASDGGVTVVDVVDTDRASWSVLSANPRSINLCFAGSRAAWTREQWMKHAKAIDVAAYLAVQDAKKYGFEAKVIAPPYTGRLPGISDHRYVTKVLGDGTHWDVGDGFPWDVFTAAVTKYASDKPAQPEPPKVKRIPQDFTDRELLIEIWDQLRGPGGKGWPQLGGKTLVDAVAELLKGS